LPRGSLDFEAEKVNRTRVLNAIKRYGVDEIPELTSPFREHYLLFKKKLDFWESIPIPKCLTKQEIIEGCLTMGPDFAKWLKKCRDYTYISCVGEGATDIPEEHILEGYKGYDSIFRESDLLFWAEETDDLGWSFIPTKTVDTKEFREEANAFLREVLPKCRFSEKYSLEWIKASRAYDPKRGKAIPLRDGILNLSEIGQGFFGKRTKIYPFPAGARDTVMADPDTLAKLKILQQFFAELSEHSENSGMSSKLSENLDRVLKRKLFHHLDYKKVGLTFPRIYFKIIGEECEKLGFRVPFLDDIQDTYILDGEDVVKTHRGFCLGWMNEAMNIASIIFLRLWRKIYNLNVDFVTFNDDVIIGDQDRDPVTYGGLIKFCLREFFLSYDIFVSDKKIFTSKAAQFLEEYYYGEEYGLDMEKRQIGTALYAKSFCTPFVWEAKMFCSVAFEYYPNNDLLEFCREGRYEESPSEAERPYIAGGWVTPFYNGLDASLMNEEDLRYIIALRSVRCMEITEPLQKFDEKAAYAQKQKLMNRYTNIYPRTDEVYQYLRDIDVRQWSTLIQTRIDLYTGKKKVFTSVLEARVDALASEVWNPP